MSSWLIDSHNAVKKSLYDLESDMDAIEKKEKEIQHQIDELSADCAKESDLLSLINLVKALALAVSTQGQQITQILQTLTPNPAVGFSLIFKGDFQDSITDSGTGSIIAIPIDSNGKATIISGAVITWVSSDSTILDVSPDPGDPTGLKGLCINATPPKLGVVQLSISAVLTDGTTITGTSPSITVVAGSATTLGVNVT
jgi:hypothetical protein